MIQMIVAGSAMSALATRGGKEEKPGLTLHEYYESAVNLASRLSRSYFCQLSGISQINKRASRSTTPFWSTVRLGPF